MIVPPRPRQLREPRERCARFRRVVQDARRKDHVERTGLQRGPPQIGLHESHLRQPEAPRRRGAEQERRAGQIGADDDAIGAREIQAHLTGSAADVGNPRVPGNRLVDQLREVTPPGARVQGVQAVARRVARERRVLVKAGDGLGARVGREAERGDAVRRLEARGTAATAPIRGERAATRRTGQQVAERVHFQKIA